MLPHRDGQFEARFVNRNSKGPDGFWTTFKMRFWGVWGCLGLSGRCLGVVGVDSVRKIKEFGVLGRESMDSSVKMEDSGMLDGRICRQFCKYGGFRYVG